MKADFEGWCDLSKVAGRGKDNWAPYFTPLAWFDVAAGVISSLYYWIAFGIIR